MPAPWIVGPVSPPPWAQRRPEPEAESLVQDEPGAVEPDEDEPDEGRAAREAPESDEPQPEPAAGDSEEPVEAAAAPEPEPTPEPKTDSGRTEGRAYRRVKPADLGPYIGEAARLILESPNAELSTPDQLRFGTNGSISVEIGGAKAGTYYNHEHKRGGSVMQLLAFEGGIIAARAAEWLRDHLGIDIDSQPRRNRFTDRIEATYDYRDESGGLVFQVVRLKDPKDFRQRAPDGHGGWNWKVKGISPIPFMLPELMAAPGNATVYVPEGEKDVLNMRARGLVATCNAGGAGKWRREYARYFTDREVVILADNDDAGRAHTQDVAANLAQVARSVRIVELPGLSEKGDVSDWIATGGTREQLEALVTDAPLHEAPPAPKEQPGADLGDEDEDSEDSDVGSAIDRFNKRYAVVNEAGKAIVYEPMMDPALRRMVLIRISFSDLRKFYQNERITVYYGEIKVTKSSADWWLNSRRRRQFLRGVVFDPTGKAPPDMWNLWTGFAVEPKPGDWSLLRSHIERVICAGNSGHAEYLLNWIARLFQQPSIAGHVAVVLRGKKGSGKGTLFRWIVRAWGQHGLHISNAKHLVGNFNAHLRDAVFLFADEAFFAADKEHESVLKALVTEPTLPIEGKYQNLIQVVNMLHIGMASNSDWVVPATEDERRYFVQDVADNRIGDRSYFKAIETQMENGGLAAMIYDMLRWPIADFEVTDVPGSDALTDQKRHSLDTLDRWWIDCLSRGFVWRAKFGAPSFAEWQSFVSTELLHASYRQWCDENRIARPQTRMLLGKRMAQMYQRERPRGNGIIGESETLINRPPENIAMPSWLDMETVIRAEHQPGYAVQSLDEARQRFADQRGVPGEWAEQG